MIEVRPPEIKIIYVDRRGNRYDNQEDYIKNDDHFRKLDLYNHFLKERNWIEKILNIKPKKL